MDVVDLIGTTDGGVGGAADRRNTKIPRAGVGGVIHTWTFRGVCLLEDYHADYAGKWVLVEAGDLGEF